jgi:hypothetical protein
LYLRKITLLSIYLGRVKKYLLALFTKRWFQRYRVAPPKILLFTY